MGHFRDDFSRAQALCALAAVETKEPMRSDLARCAVAFGVGALDAYLCDAFVDCLARTLKSCSRSGIALPEGYAKLALPAGPLFASYASRPNWGLRMAARSMMERENLLQVRKAAGLFNPVLPKSQQLWGGSAAALVAIGPKRLAGISAAKYAALPTKKKSGASKAASSAALKRVESVIQRRHDIVHNCDRPKTSPQRMKPGSAKNMLADIGSFVTVLDAHLGKHQMY